MYALLLNSALQGLCFLSERRALKLLFSGNVDVLASWGESFRWVGGSRPYPAILKLRYYVRPVWKRKKFRRRAVFQRDRYRCAYCQEFLGSKCTLDHVIPRDSGGPSTWENCVTSCFPCNNKKGNRTPEQANMSLSFRPFAPGGSLFYDYQQLENHHCEWKYYLNTGY